MLIHRLRTSYILFILCACAPPLQADRVVFPSGKHTKTNTKPAVASHPTHASLWARAPENVVIRGADDATAATRSRLPGGTPPAPVDPNSDDYDDEGAIFGVPSAAQTAGDFNGDEDDDDFIEMSFEDPHEMLSALSDVFQIDDDMMQEIQNFDFSSLANMDFTEEDELSFPGGTDEAGHEMSDSKAPSISFDQLGDFSSLFAQE